MVIEFVFTNFAAQRIAVNAKHLGGAALIAVGAFQNSLDEPLFKFTDRFLEKNSALHHLTD